MQAVLQRPEPRRQGRAGKGQRAGYAGPECSFQLGHVGADGSIEDMVSKRFAQLVNEKSGGKIEITIYGNSQMGGLVDLVDAIRYDTLDFALFAMGNAESYFPKSSIEGMPYLFSGYGHVEAFYNSGVYGELCDEFAAATNIRELGSFHTGFRDILSNKEIQSAEDMKGLSIRVPEAPLFVKTFSALGCNTVTLPGADVFQALQTGLVQATEAAPSYMVSMNYQEVSKYCIVTNHVYTGNSIFTSENKLKGMDPAAAAVVKEAAAQASQEAWEIVAEQDEAALSAMEAAGVTVIHPDMDSFQKVMTGIMGELGVESIDGGQELMDAIRACDPS